MYSGGKDKIATEADIVKPFYEQKRASRSIPTSETLPEHPIPLEHIHEYDDLQREAARRAWAQVEKEHGRQVRISEKQLRDQGAQLYDELTTSRVLDAVKEGGISRKSLSDQDQEAVITPLVRKYPGLFRNDAKTTIDELAKDHGYETTDALIQDLQKAKGKKQFLDDYIEEQKQWTGQELGLSPEEWHRRLLEKEQEIFKELTKSAPDERLAKIRERMGANATLQLPPGGFGTGPHVMNIFAVKDRSSFLHEAAHLFLERLSHDAYHPEGSERAKSDLGTLQKWWADHAEDMHGQFQQARKGAEAAVKASPGDEQAWARVAAYRSAAKLLGESSESGVEFFKDFAGHLGRDMDRGDVRMSLMTPLHELFARTFEAYLMEGKAPSPGLQPVFDSFRAWLKRIYERVTGRGRAFAGLSQVAGTPIEVSPGVRGVMDRMLATDEQIDITRQQQRLGRLFKTAKDAGMTSAEWKAYIGSVGKAVDEARATVQRKAMAQLEREKSEEWEKEKERLRPEVESEINAKRDVQALHYLRRGRLLGEEDTGENRAPVRMNRDAVVRLIGEDGLKNLPFGLYKKEGGFDPLDLGEMFGYRSGSEMLSDLLAIEADRRGLDAKGMGVASEEGYRQHLVDDALDARLKAHFGDMTTDGTMPQAAMDAVHNDAEAQALATELRALIRLSGQQRGADRLHIFGGTLDPKAWARDTIGDRKIWEVTNLNRYATDERRAATAAEQAMVKGDFAGAIEAKRQQILSHALYVEARKASESLEGLEDQADRFGKKRMIASLDQGALDQIHTLLERFGLKTPGADLREREILSNWVAKVRADYGDVYVPDSLFDPNLPPRYKDMTVSQIRDLSDAVKSIAHVGRDMKKILVGGKKVGEAEIAEEMMRSANENVERKELSRERNPGVVQGDFEQRQKARWVKAQDLFGGLHASLSRLEQEMIDRFDGGDSNGIWNRAIWRRIKDSRAYFDKRMDEMSQGMEDLGKVYSKESSNRLDEMLPDIKELIDSKTGEPLRISRGELLSMMLNWGNESNKSKLCRGEGWRPETVQAVFDRLGTKADWDFVQGVWDLMERLRPDVKEQSLRMTGIEPEWIETSPVITPYGEYRGGYYPMAYDPSRSGDAYERFLSDKALMDDQGRAGRPVTYGGHKMSRAERYARPIRFSLDVIPQHFDDVIRDLAWRETISDLCRLIKNEAIRDTINTTLGENFYKQLIPMLKRTVGDVSYDRTGNEWWERAARGFRLNVTMMGLGYRASTMLVHGATALSNSIGEIGTKWTVEGFKDFYGPPEKMARMRDFINERSSEMAHRMNTVDYNIREAMKKTLGRKSIFEGARRFAFHGIAMLDMGSAWPTWLGAYGKALAPEVNGGLGMKVEADAIYYADKAVRNAHGSGNPEDIAAVQNVEFMKPFTMFYTFWNHFYNRQVDIARRGVTALREGNAGDFAAVLARSWWYFVMPTMLHALIKGQRPSDDEGWFNWAAKEIGSGLFSGLPFIRDISNAFQGHEYRITPLSDVGSAFMHTVHDTEKWWDGEDVSASKFMRHALDTAGYSFGLPLGQADQSAQYLWDVWNGDQNPEDVAGFVHDLVLGARKKK
ncbi:MAG: hypothetical protein P4L43_19465 [Syntrophobacteraceae bacterium]|nr:hypothetical protein [Syntrophobacteraceae bacterium]